MRVTMKAGCGVRDAGCELKIICQEEDLLILTGGMWVSIKIWCGMKDEKQKIVRSSREELQLKPGEIGINILNGTGVHRSY